MDIVDKEKWLNHHGTLSVYIKHGYYRGDWNYGYASQIVNNDSRDVVIARLYCNAMRELFSWCVHHEN